eukprot:343204-Pelagomonas_calceolata.AAC.1
MQLVNAIGGVIWCLQQRKGIPANELADCFSMRNAGNCSLSIPNFCSNDGILESTKNKASKRQTGIGDLKRGGLPDSRVAGPMLGANLLEYTSVLALPFVCVVGPCLSGQ